MYSHSVSKLCSFKRGTSSESLILCIEITILLYCVMEFGFGEGVVVVKYQLFEVKRIHVQLSNVRGSMFHGPYGTQLGWH